LDEIAKPGDGIFLLDGIARHVLPASESVKFHPPTKQQMAHAIAGVLPSELDVHLCPLAAPQIWNAAAGPPLSTPKNSICATASGRNQTHSFIFSAVSSSTHRDLGVSGRLTKGIVGETRWRILSKTCRT
jgi:hypothetical protein